MTKNKSNSAHVVIDMLYDFIDGSLACINGETAVDKAVDFINNSPQYPVIFICDSHPAEHCSFAENGGIWPPHCVSGTRGASVHDKFYKNVINPASRPSPDNILKKGEDPKREQYSGFEAVSISGETLSDYLSRNNIKEVFVSGIATEFCVNETVKDLSKAGFYVTVIKEALAYVDERGHLDTLENFKNFGITII